MPSAASDRQAVAAAAPPRWRFLIRPKWLGWHATMVVSVAGMCALGYWQYRRAMEGNALSWAYTFEWPIFAVFAIVFWAKTIRDEFAPPAVEPPPGPAGMAPDGTELTASGGGQAGAYGAAAAGRETGPAEPEDEDLAAYNAYLARLHGEAGGRGRRRGWG